MDDSVVSDSPAASLAVCALGAHRSGASVLAGMLNVLGVDLGPSVVPATSDKREGAWHYKQIVTWHINLLETLGSCSEDFLPLPEGWEARPEIAPHRDYMLALLRAEFASRPIWGFKDPRTCRTLPLWNQLLSQVGAQPRFLLVVRNPDEIARSMEAASACPYNQSLLLSLSHMLESERHTRGEKRAVVTFDQLMADWRQEAVRIGTELDIRWPLGPQSVSAQALGVPNSALRHQNNGEPVTAQQAVSRAAADPTLAQWTFDAYQTIAAAAVDPARLDLTQLDRINDQFRSAAPALAGWRPRRLTTRKSPASFPPRI